jgi:hypothetical protein
MALVASLKADSLMMVWAKPLPDPHLLKDRHQGCRIGGGDGGTQKQRGDKGYAHDLDGGKSR